MENAEEYYADALCSLAGLYAAGQGVAQDLEEAVRLYRLAAELGHAEAQYRLAERYWRGEGVEQNLVEAARLYRLAAD